MSNSPRLELKSFRAVTKQYQAQSFHKDIAEDLAYAKLYGYRNV